MIHGRAVEMSLFITLILIFTGSLKHCLRRSVMPYHVIAHLSSIASLILKLLN